LVPEGESVVGLNAFRGLAARHKLLRSGQIVALLTTLVIAAIGTTASLMIWNSRQEYLGDRQRDMQGMGVVLAEQTARYVQIIDLIMLDVQAKSASLDIESLADFKRRMDLQEVHVYLAERMKNIPQADAVAVIAADGITLNSSRPVPLRGTNVADRDYFSYFSTHDDPGVFFGSQTKSIVTGRPSLFFARRINGKDGSFLGVVLGVVDARYLGEFYEAAVEHLGDSITLLRRDGTVLMRYPLPASATGEKPPEPAYWYAQIAKGGGNYITPRSRIGPPTLVSMHPLHDYPLVVDVSAEEAVVFGPWRTQAIHIMAIALVGMLTFTTLIWMLARQFRHQAEQNSRLEEAAISLSEGQQMLRAFAEMSVDWFWEQDAEFRFKQKTQIPFLTESDDTGRTRWELAGEAMSEERWGPHKTLLAQKLPFRNFHWERFGLNGLRHFITISGDPVYNRTGAFTGYRGTGRDITAEVESHERFAKANFDLDKSREQFQLVLENMAQGITFFDADEKLIVSNQRYGEMYRLSASQVRSGTLLSDILNWRLANGTLENISPAEFLERRKTLSAAREPYDLVDELRDGRTIAMHYQPLPNGGWLATHEDITDRRLAEATLVFMARHDALTRLPNRFMFRERLEQALERVGRGSGCAVLCLDLDRFKLVNDTLGHPAGDALLRATAERLQACVREGDTVARLGGDEFAIVQLAAERAQDAELLATRIVAAFSVPFDIEGHLISAGTSVGVAMAPGDGTSPEKLLKNADIALYLAKTEGTSRVRFFEPEMDANIQLRRTLELDLRGAIVRNEFEINYQPLIDMASSKVTGFEALIRWRHPVRGLVSPAEFIPLAEETGMIVAVGEWVLRTACLEAKNWPTDISIAVNLSPIQFKQGDLASVVTNALEASGLRPDRLELEITETVLLQNTVATLVTLHKLRALGILVALDDFGTGFSSLSYLRSFPFDKIKIDQSFVRDLVEDKEALSIIRAITGLGHSLRMKTTAEGVETQEQLDMLRVEGCTEVQGYLFSRPMPASELPSLIERLNHISGRVH
jgi:diguanylate cyclase (GGDEF)-like protein